MPLAVNPGDSSEVTGIDEWSPISMQVILSGFFQRGEGVSNKHDMTIILILTKFKAKVTTLISVIILDKE